MGVSTVSDICKNVVSVGTFDLFEKVMDDSEFDLSDGGTFESHSIPYNGWIVEGFSQCGRGGWLHGYMFKKVTDRVYKVNCVNSHEYARVGEVWNVISSEDADAVKLFINDFKEDILLLDSDLDLSIEDIDAVQKTS